MSSRNRVLYISRTRTNTNPRDKMNSGKDISYEILTTKRDDPNYAQVSGHVPVEVAREFGVLCAIKRITKSEALEEAMKLLLEQNKDLLPPKPLTKEKGQQ